MRAKALIAALRSFRVMRVLVTATSLGSILLAFATCAVWVRSWTVLDEAGWISPRTAGGTAEVDRIATSLAADSYGGRIAIYARSGRLDEYDFTSHNGFWIASKRRERWWPATINTSGRLGFSYDVRRVRSKGYSYHERVLVFPHWSLAVALGLPPTIWLALRFRARRITRRALSGLCFGCGYDLTGNISGICPECGQATARHLDRGVVSPGAGSR